MKTKLYASELLKKLVTEEELEILTIVWDTQSDIDQKIELLLELIKDV